MISIRNQGSVVNAAVFGKFELDDYRQFERAVDYTLQQFGGHASVLFDLRDMSGFTLDVAWEELRYTRRHARDFERIAVVTGDEWVAWSAWISRAFVDAEFRVFDDDVDALAWVRGEGAPAVFNRIVSAAELAGHLDDPDWVVCDCRHELTDPDYGMRAYAPSHIQGARFVHLDRDLSSAKTGRNGRHPLPAPADFARFLGSLGITNTTQVVAYDDAGGPYAARLWWMMRWIGHDAVAVLDGGIGAWTAAGQPVTSVRPEPKTMEFKLNLHETARVDVDFVRAHLGDAEWKVVDARAPERFRGDTEPIDPVGGHIPGAVNRFFKLNLTPDGRFKPAAELRDDFRRLLGTMPPARVVHQCGSGVTACHNLLAMELAGLPGARLYPGSWSEWCADPARPVAKGPE
jgi:thiosulfate/3-mercaptopyruvate sulfurtransferase